MQHKHRRKSVALAIAGLLATLLSVVSSGTAQAAPFVPPTKWTPTAATAGVGHLVTSPNGQVTAPCDMYGSGQDLTTRSSTGTVVRQISRTSQIDGMNNCIEQPVVDKNGVLYGIPSGGPAYGPNLLAYAGNTLKWKYPVFCSNSQRSQYVVGANGNIYATTYGADGVHLIGLNPTLAAGQTVPTKVLDIKVTNDCSQMLRAYKDGVMLHGQQNSAARFYSYSGKLLATTTGDLWYEKLNAEGRLFTSKNVNGGTITTGVVTAFDPNKGQNAWTVTASTPGANTYDTQITPLPGGGVLARVFEQKMLTGGIPATPTVKVFTLVMINANGVKVWTKELPNEEVANPNNAYEGYPVLIADTTGKVAIVRLLREATTGGSWPNTVPAVEMGVINVSNGAVIYGQTLRGNPVAANGSIYGYNLSWIGGAEATTGTNGLYVQAGQCPEMCSTMTPTLYPFTVSGLGLDYPRGTVLAANTAAQPAPVSYVALGDSYSSGQGAGNYDEWTATTSNTCYRSANAFAQVLSRDPYSRLRLDNFRACGGSKMPALQNKWPAPNNQDEQRQDSALNANTQVVTITIGGNDIGFEFVIKDCFLIVNCNSAVASATSQISTLGPALTAAYNNILTKAPNAKVYVIGYPPIVTADSNLCASVSTIGYPFIFNQKVQARQVLDLLNTKIRNTVDAIRATNTRLNYVDATASTSPFNGHDVCSSDPYFNGLLLLPAEQPGSFHPNMRGQKAYAELVAALAP